MPSRILRPLASGFYDFWTLGVGASKVAAVDSLDPVAHDDLTTYIFATTAVVQSFTVTPWPPGPFIVNTLSFGVRAGSEAAGWLPDIDLGCRLNSANSTVLSLVDIPVGWTTGGPTAATRPSPGGAWLHTDGAVEMYVAYQNGTRGDVTSIWGVLDYTIPGRGFLFLMSLIGAFGLHLVTMEDFTRFNNHVQCTQNEWLNKNEVVQAWDEYKSYTHPTFFFPKEG